MRLDAQSLNRALLARQGLLEPLRLDVVGGVEAIGAVQSQYWPAAAAALASRLAGFSPGDLHAALEAGELATGTLIRGTLHLSSAREHAAYATVAHASGACEWRRTTREPLPAGDELRTLLAGYAAGHERTREQMAAFIEDWLDRHPGAIPEAEARRQRESGWRPLLTWPGLTRVGRWDGGKGPERLRAAPVPPGSPAAPEERDALDEVVLRHLRAFGPSGVEDVARWAGVKTEAARRSVARLADGLARFEDAATGQCLYDVVDAPRPPADVPAPVRLLPWFDSTLLAYAPGRRQRILPEGTWDRVYRRSSLRVDPTFLVDGFVAGLWSVKATARAATLTLAPFARLAASVLDDVAGEAERLVRVLYPATTAHVDVAEA